MADHPGGEAGRLSERLDSLKRCFALSRIISESLDLSDVLERIMTTSRQALGAETVSLLLVDDAPGPGQGELVFTVAQGPASSPLQTGFRLKQGEGLAGWVAQSASPLMLADAYDDPRFNQEVDKLTGYRTRSMLCVPLVYRERVVGVAQVINKVDGGVFCVDDLEILSLLAAQAAVAIVNARLHREALDKQRLEFDMEVAASVQQGFWPKSAPPLSGFEVAGISLPCDATGGDYYDYIMRPGFGGKGRTCCLAVGDVTGHGVQAALLMASARAFLRSRLQFPGDPATVVGDVNRLLARDLGLTGRFMTLFLMEIDTVSLGVRFVRAGHDPALLFDPATGAFTELGGRGIPLGIDGDWCYEETSLGGVPPGSVLVCGTDGIWETRNASGTMYGKERLCQVVRRTAASDAKTVARAVLADLDAFRQQEPRLDDVTLVVVKATPEMTVSEATCS